MTSSFSVSTLLLCAAAEVLASTTSGAACDAALARDCGAARKQGFMKCGECAGTHQADLLRAGCENTDTAAFCQNNTCATHLADKCSDTLGDCAHCTFCAKNQRLLCSAEQQDAFCAPGCDRMLRCELELENDCEDARQQGLFACATCTGAHAQSAHAAKCTNSMISNFCQNTSCIARLADACHTKTQYKAETCFDCARCAYAYNSYTGCRMRDEQAFCEKVSPPTTGGPSCDATLTALCGSTRHSGGNIFDCVKCSGRYIKETDGANCSSTQITDFCLNKPCFPAMQLACGHTVGSCGSCAECVMAKVPKSAQCSAQDQRSFCDAGCVGAMYSWNEAWSPALIASRLTRNCSVPSPALFQFPSTYSLLKMTPTPDYRSAPGTFTIGPNIGSGQYKYIGGVLLPDGRVLLVPENADTIGLYNPQDNTFIYGPN
eukprot:COSAG05_NODE_3691_length_1904_cov_1.136842_1_plen_432_part_01